MWKQWKIYNKRIFCSFFGLLLFLIFFNIVIDPFEIFNVPKIKKINAIKPDKDRNQRITKMVSLKLERKPIEAVFLGSSRVNSSISEKFYFQSTGKISKNLGMNALSHDETFKVANNVLLIHPEIKTVYLGLDFFRFLEKNKDNKRDVPISNSKNLTISEFNPLILSFNTTIASFNTLIKNLKKDKSHIKQDKKPFFIRKLALYSGNYKEAELAYGEFEKIKKFKQEITAKGYDIVLYVNPVHVLDIALIDKMGYLPVYNDWKINLAKNFDYIDFSILNELTCEPVNKDTKYFFENSHSTEFMGNVVITDLLSGKNLYSEYVTSKNVVALTNKNVKALKSWEKKNPYWMNKLGEILANDLS